MKTALSKPLNFHTLLTHLTVLPFCAVLAAIFLTPYLTLDSRTLGLFFGWHPQGAEAAEADKAEAGKAEAGEAEEGGGSPSVSETDEPPESVASDSTRGPPFGDAPTPQAKSDDKNPLSRTLGDGGGAPPTSIDDTDVEVRCQRL